MLEIIIRENGVDEIIYTVTDTDRAIIESDVPCCKQWLKAGPLNLIQGKAESCRDRLITKWMPTLALENEMLPSNKDALCKMIIGHSDYQDRKAQNAAQEILI